MDTTLDADPKMARTVGNGVVAVYADLVCPWATIVLDRLHRTRDDLGLETIIDIRPLPLELVNQGAAPFSTHVAGTTAAAAAEPDYGFAPWDSPEGFPVSTLLPLEAVRAAYEQSIEAAHELDTALRRAFFVEHECISLHHVIIDAASRCETVDENRLDDQLRCGRCRSDVFEHWTTAEELGIAGSPHVVLADGTAEFLPSLELEADGDEIRITSDEPGHIEELLHVAEQTRQHD